MEIQYLLFIFILNHPVEFLLLFIWTFTIKGAALLRAFERKERAWFAALFLINTLGLLEVYYLYAKRQPKITAKHEKLAEALVATIEEHVTKDGLPAVALRPSEVFNEGGLTKEGEITYDDFAKVELKVAKIMEAERVAKSEKLIKLQLEVGDEQRQIVAGIGKAYSPEELVGKEIIIVANLAPRALMGVESHGMLLAAGGAEHPVLLTPEKEIESGAKVK